jgi:hypothetical protein
MTRDLTFPQTTVNLAGQITPQTRTITCDAVAALWTKLMKVTTSPELLNHLIDQPGHVLPRAAYSSPSI